MWDVGTHLTNITGIQLSFDAMPESVALTDHFVYPSFHINICPRRPRRQRGFKARRAVFKPKRETFVRGFGLLRTQNFAWLLLVDANEAFCISIRIIWQTMNENV